VTTIVLVQLYFNIYIVHNCISAEREEGHNISLSVQVAMTTQTTVVNLQGIQTPFQLHYAAQFEREEISCIFILLFVVCYIGEMRTTYTLLLNHMG
jgi:hypothetical protein